VCEPAGHRDHGHAVVRLGAQQRIPDFALHYFTESLRVQMAFTGVTVVELIPPAVETPLNRDEAFAREMKLPKGMDVEVFAKKAIAGIEAGKLEVRPGLANVMKILSQIAPEFTLKQVAKMIPSLGLQSQ
jgi:uncharacterized oxidoreductase